MISHLFLILLIAFSTALADKNGTTDGDPQLVFEVVPRNDSIQEPVMLETENEEHAHQIFVENFGDDVTDDDINSYVIPESADEVNKTEVSAVPIAPDNQTTTKQSTTLTTTTVKPTTSNVGSLDGYVLPTDGPIVKQLDNTTIKNEEEVRIETLFDKTSDTYTRLKIWINENPNITAIVIGILSGITAFFAVLVIKECYRLRSKSYSRRRMDSITRDLYNTSFCSQRYEKVTLPENREITLQLMSADNSEIYN